MNRTCCRSLEWTVSSGLLLSLAKGIGKCP